MTLGRAILVFETDVPIGERVAALSDSQHGPVSAQQLVACGLSSSGISRRGLAGSLHRLHRGVYVPGHRSLSWRGHVAAALLACGCQAAASHLTAARLRALRADSRTLIDVAVPSSPGRAHRHVIAHSYRRLRPHDVSVIHGLPATSVARTLLDCAPRLGRRGTEKLVAEAEHLGTFDLGAVKDALEHVAGHPGRAIVRNAIGDVAGARGRTASPAEDALLLAFRAAGLEEPEANSPVLLPDGGAVYPDFLWRDGALVVEADPRATHDTTASYRSDRVRDRLLDAIGLQTMRFSDTDLASPAACAAEVRARLRVRRAQRHEFRPSGGQNS